MTTSSRDLVPDEAALVQKVCVALSQRGWRTLTEVGLMTRSVDIVAIDPEGTIVTIECKIRDWRSALRQVRDHKVSCRMVAICMPRRTPTDAMRDEFEREGVGFLAYDPLSDDLGFAIEPRPSEYYWETAGEWLAARITEREAV